MSLTDGNNPSSKTGQVQSQNVVQALVVDDKDPEKMGRFKCRILGEQGDLIPDDKLQWISCIQSGSGQIRQVGSWPPGKYMKGSRVTLLNMGQQGWAVLGAISNDGVDKNDQKSDQQLDIHHTATDHSLAAFTGLKNLRFHNILVNGIDFRSLNPLTNNLLNLNSTVQQFINQDPYQAVNKLAQVPDMYGARSQIKVVEGMFKSIGIDRFFGEVLNAQKFMQQAASPEMIPNALGMLEQLKQTATKALNIPMVDSVGGLGNILGALQGIASSASNTNKGSQQQDQQNLEEELRRIYRLLKKKEPLDQFGNETLDYKAWKQDYLNGVVTS